MKKRIAQKKTEKTPKKMPLISKHVLPSLSEIDALIRQGKILKASHIVRKIFKSQHHAHYSEKELLQLALLARRTFQPMTALKILTPLLREALTKNITPQIIQTAPEIWMEYAVNLSLLGSSDEALHILEKIDLQKNPKALFNIAFTQISQWNYAGALKNLSSLLNRFEKDLEPYFILITQVNMAACFAAENRPKEAIHFIEPVLKEALRTERLLLAGNLFEISAQAHLQLGQWQKAQECIEEAKKLLPPEEKLFGLFVEKWDALIFLHKSTLPLLDRLEKIQKLKLKAWRLQEWETLRDLDFQYAQFNPDPYLIQKLYYGTASPYYKKRITALASKNSIKIEPSFHFDFSWSNLFRVENELNILSMKLKQKNYKNVECDVSKTGHLLDRLLQVLSSDFYRPFKIAELHEKLFPKRYFNPNSSPTLIRQAMKRLRIKLKKTRSPFKITHNQKGYRLQGKKNFMMTLTLRDSFIEERELDSKIKYKFLKTYRKFTHQPFTCKEASFLFKESIRQTSRLLLEGTRQNLIQKMKTGRRTHYQFRMR